jgi:HK97 gp10 family phage protein
MKATVRIDGLKELEASLKKMGTQLNREMQPALEAAGRLVADEAKRLAPEDSGTLKESIDIQRTTIKRNEISVDVGPGKKAFYSMWVEFGHNIIRGTSKATRKMLGKAQARPYLRPAYDTKKEEAKQIIRDRLAAILRMVGR